MEKKTTGFEYESLAIFQKFVPRGIVKKTLRNRIVSKLSVSYQIVNSYQVCSPSYGRVTGKKTQFFRPKSVAV